MTTEVEKQELLEFQIATPENLSLLVQTKSPEKLAEMATLHAIDFRRLLGSMDCIQMYMDSGQIREAKKIVDDALDFYQTIANIRAKEIQPSIPSS
ncbi:hypothetical protein ACH42_17230 [Endozoicomonas sp. (ex Bugula neritina AB1)]|nr:hypothetical protein ACH42_17230 [Endozoicomonas sp. (ex Bugula neritina AB1)]